MKNIEVAGKTFGEKELFLICGPCVIEEEKIMMDAAERIKKIAERLHLPLIFKSSFMKDNRSSVEYYQGPGLEKGLRLLEKIKTTFDMPVLSDVHYLSQVKPAAEVLDVIQIPAYLCMQTSLVTEAAKTGKPVNIKHGQFIAPENMIKPVQKVEHYGNKNIILTERGYTFGYNDLIVDPRSFYELNRIGYPVVFDITHCIRRYGIPSADPAGGTRQYLGPIARAGVAAGIDGIFVEAHPKACDALCDAASQLDIDQLEEFLKPLIEIHYTEKKYRK
ncbi:3-deoxy-8-phosphooctulonate synthase [Candidatus Sulfidibacterium hydrothermale]|uniref:3-deoxy-8-phosphooctulonate synthase n=1 Tax=Candidatus Sulfidibacterium hydrothermale TaxID=2875962 RepID=UPI001F0B6589|nr:3-deoxy-8-phosphooctulonate synthase [Candidatus Sulfidibacterium hydrothermale]UBM63049.1 3-deoxy-8-phosphooctulonate synthase [Candidatus Sulfidibacterium hydrothermale]